MISPMDLKEKDKKDYDLDDIIAMIDGSINASHGNWNYEKALIGKSIPFHIRNSIAKLYLKAGWKYVYHATLYELNQGKPGTSFILSEYDLGEFSDYFKVIENRSSSCLTNPFIVSKGGEIYE